MYWCYIIIYGKVRNILGVILKYNNNVIIYVLVNVYCCIIWYYIINIIIISYYQYHYHIMINIISKSIQSSTWLYHYQYHHHIMINIILKSIWSSKSLSISYCNIYDWLHTYIIINIYDQVINTIWCIKWYLIWLL